MERPFFFRVSKCIFACLPSLLVRPTLRSTLRVLGDLDVTRATRQDRNVGLVIPFPVQIIVVNSKNDEAVVSDPLQSLYQLEQVLCLVFDRVGLAWLAGLGRGEEDWC